MFFKHRAEKKILLCGSICPISSAQRGADRRRCVRGGVQEVRVLLPIGDRRQARGDHGRRGQREHLEDRDRGPPGDAEAARHGHHGFGASAGR